MNQYIVAAFPPPSYHHLLTTRLRTKLKSSTRRLIHRQRTDACRKGEEIVMPSVRRDRVCLGDRSLICKRLRISSNGLPVVGPAVAAGVILGVGAGDGYEVRDGHQAAGVGLGGSGRAINTECG